MKIAITGGIGTGKSYICQQLGKYGIKVYDCDEAAKRLMRESAEIHNGLISLVGQEVYQGSELQKGILAEFLLQSEANKQKVNAIVHPAVAADFMVSDYEWLESAILFESGFHRRVNFDYVICVTAPEAIRVRRILERDNISSDKALEWIHRQMPQQYIEEKSNYIIVNDGIQDTDIQIKNILNRL